MENKRRHDRILKSIKCEVYSDGLTFSSSIDISEGGMFISTPEPLNENSEIDLTLYLPEEKSLSLKGFVKWSRDELDDKKRAGMGVEFINTTEEQNNILKKYINI